MENVLNRQDRKERPTRRKAINLLHSYKPKLVADSEGNDQKEKA